MRIGRARGIDCLHRVQRVNLGSHHTLGESRLFGDQFREEIVDFSVRFDVESLKSNWESRR